MQLHKCPKEFYPPLSDYPTFGPKFGDFDLSEGGSLATQSTPPGSAPEQSKCTIRVTQHNFINKEQELKTSHEDYTSLHFYL